MGVLLAAVVLVMGMYLYGGKWIIDVTEVEKSNTAKKYLENAKTSQEQMMLKGDTNLFTSYISDDISIQDQNVLNKIYYELKYNKELNNNIVENMTVLCEYINTKMDYISIDQCEDVLSKDYNFIDMKSNGAEITVNSSYENALSHINSLHQNGYNVSANTATLSNNTLYKFDSNLREIETMAAGDRNYVEADIVNYTNSATLKEDAIKINELSNIINTSLTNKNTLLENIVDVGITTKYSTMKELIQNKDSDGNIVTLTKEFSDETFNDSSSLTNLEVVNSFKINKTETFKTFSLAQ